MAEVLIIGYGNPLRGDDALGWLAAGELARTLDPDRVEVLPVHQLTPELAEPVSRARLVVFMDATVEAAPGELGVREVGPRAPEPGAFTHQFTPEVLLAFSEKLYGAKPRAVLISLGVCSVEFGDGLSPEVRSGMPLLLERVRTWVERALACPAGVHTDAVLFS